MLVIQDPMDVTGKYLTRATVGNDESGWHDVNFRFDYEGGQLFGQLTGQNQPTR